MEEQRIMKYEEQQKGALGNAVPFAPLHCLAGTQLSLFLMINTNIKQVQQDISLQTCLFTVLAKMSTWVSI